MAAAEVGGASEGEEGRRVSKIHLELKRWDGGCFTLYGLHAHSSLQVAPDHVFDFLGRICLWVQ